MLSVSAFLCFFVSKKSKNDLRSSCFFLFPYFEVKCPCFQPCLLTCYPSFPLRLAFSSVQSLWICARGEFVLLRRFSIFPCSHWFGYLLPHWVANAAVTLHYLPSNLFAFHLTLRTENEALLFLDTWGGGKYSTQMLCNSKNIKMFHIFHCFDSGQCYWGATCGIHEGVCWTGGNKQPSSWREWKCSVMVQHGD